jgi:hypothetical protein
MLRLVSLSLAALALGLMSAVGAAAAPGEKGEMCVAGHGKAVCCKASVADHCGYVSCCEKGNAGFFTARHCGTCDQHKASAHKTAAHKAHKPAVATAEAKGCGAGAGVASCEVGNRGFFSNTACGTCTTKAHAAKASCCAGEKAAK